MYHTRNRAPLVDSRRNRHTPNFKSFSDQLYLGGNITWKERQIIEKQAQKQARVQKACLIVEVIICFAIAFSLYLHKAWLLG